MPDVKVYRIDAIKLFRERLATFGEDAKNALISVDMDTRRTVDFILREQPMHWKAQLKKRHEVLQQAKAELFRRKLAEINPGSLDDTMQREAVRKAEMRVQEAEQKLEKIKKWATPLQQAVDQQALMYGLITIGDNSGDGDLWAEVCRDLLDNLGKDKLKSLEGLGELAISVAQLTAERSEITKAQLMVGGTMYAASSLTAKRLAAVFSGGKHTTVDLAINQIDRDIKLLSKPTVGFDLLKGW